MFEFNLCERYFNKIEAYFDNFFENTMDEAHLDEEIRFKDIFTKKDIINKIKNFRSNEISNLLGSLEYPDKKIHFDKILNFKKSKFLTNFGITKDLFLKKRKILKNCKNINIKYIDKKENYIGNPKIYKFLNFGETGTNLNNFGQTLTAIYLRIPSGMI